MNSLRGPPFLKHMWFANPTYPIPILLINKCENTIDRFEALKEKHDMVLLGGGNNFLILKIGTQPWDLGMI